MLVFGSFVLNVLDDGMHVVLCSCRFLGLERELLRWRVEEIADTRTEVQGTSTAGSIASTCISVLCVVGVVLSGTGTARTFTWLSPLTLAGPTTPPNLIPQRLLSTTTTTITATTTTTTNKTKDSHNHEQ